MPKRNSKLWIQTLMDDDEIFNNMNSPFPLAAIIEALEIILNNGTFDFGNTSWKQLTGVAMGAPSACRLATLYYGIHENETLLPKYDKNLHLFKLFIDDIFGIWIVNNDTDMLEFEKIEKRPPLWTPNLENDRPVKNDNLPRPHHHHRRKKLHHNQNLPSSP